MDADTKEESSREALLARIGALEAQLAEAQQLIDAIKEGEVDAFAINRNNTSEIYTLQSGDYAYRMLIEKFGEGAVNLTEDGLVVYCNAYFSELTHRAYDKVIGSYITDMVAEDSRGAFHELFGQALKGYSKGEINLDINGVGIPVYVSLTSLQPKLATVGMVLTDLTEKKKLEQQVILKNAELERQNEELASFTYVASHDLQEPLRKIQAFSSRIMLKDKDRFSEEGRDYFARIIRAASRMQNLIEDLLNYSRTNTSELVFAVTEVNDILDKVKQDLHDDIRERNARVLSEGLPRLTVIPGQFHQLLLNLLSNAIKYSKPDTQPLIRLDAERIPAGELTHEGLLPGTAYWKISIADNGIGFDQQYEYKIFELFQRLHGKSEYEGTGIGLAICKKIVQNHGGVITATGQPGIGATFNLFIPIYD
jgi:PAS domain S-box-containing protein